MVMEFAVDCERLMCSQMVVTFVIGTIEESLDVQMLR